MAFDFQAGGEQYGVYFPALKTVGESIKSQVGLINSVFYDYQPGNGTRYEVLFNTFETKHGRRTVMTLVGFRKSMELSGSMGLHSIDYLREKLGLGGGDCYALIPLINAYFEEVGE